MGSKLISWASGLLIKDLEKIPSHTAILVEIDELPEGFIIESVLESGVRIIPFSVWSAKNELCYKIPCEPSVTIENVFKVLKTIWNKDYDWPGIAYFAICFIRNFLFKTPFPKINKWQKEHKFFCSEAVATLSNYCKADMATPAKMCSDMLKRKS